MRPVIRIVFALFYVLVPAAIIGGVLWRYTWCHVPDPAMAACKGTISAVAIRRCVPKRIPPQTELQKSIPVISRSFRACQNRMKRESPEAVLPYLDSTLAVIEAEHGRNSVAYASALTSVMMQLARTPEAGRSTTEVTKLSLAPLTGRFDLMRPYSEAAISVSREVYGAEHRETAMALHVHADVLLHLKEGKYADRAVSDLREAVSIRRRVLGAGHMETLAGEGRLAAALLEKWRNAEDRQSQMGLLDEAEMLTKRVSSGLQAKFLFVGFSRFSERDMNALLDRIAYARGENGKAVEIFRRAFIGHIGVSCTLHIDACKEYAKALRRLGKDKDAAAVEEGVEYAVDIARSARERGE